MKKADFHDIIPAGSGPDEIAAAMRAMDDKGAKRSFVTLVNADYPMDGRDHGLHIQGYKSIDVPEGGDTLDPVEAYAPPPPLAPKPSGKPKPVKKRG